MRLAFLFFLLLAVITGSAYSYVSTVALCVVPVHYRLGVIDKQFGISEVEARESLSQAEAVWESLTERELFIYDEAANFTVNFVFDDRQATALDQHNTENRLNTVEEQNQKILNEFKDLENIFTLAKETYKKNVDTYNHEQGDLNEQIEAYNSSDNPSPKREQELRTAQNALEAKALELDQEAERLNIISTQLNSLAERGNVMVEVYNQTVQSYNIHFGEAREFTQGDYQGTSINIYTFLDKNELGRVFVHEFGHALGINHVENKESMMYYRMGGQPEVASLSHEDQTAFFATCGTDTDLKNRLVTKISKFFKL